MTNNWRGLYLKAPAEHVLQTLIRLTRSRSYVVKKYISSLDQSALENVWDSGIAGRLDTLEVIFTLTLDKDWTRLIGLEFSHGAIPRLFYIYELIMLLGCDAFECGYVEDVSWWYSYFEEGLIRDRFWSDPLTPLTSFRDKLWGPDDPRVIYAKCLNIERMNDLRSLPTQIANQFQGSSDALYKLLKPQAADLFENIKSDMHPERSIERLGKVINLPYIGEFETADFLEDLASSRQRMEPTPYWVTRSIEQGLALLVLQHPKSFLL